MRQQHWLTFLLLMLCALLAACAAPQTGSLSSAPLRVAYSSRWGDYTMVVADEAGFFKQFGVAVKPVYYENSFDALVDMAAGQLDGSLMSLGDVMSIETHLPVKVVAASDSGGSGTVVAIPQIHNLAELRGRRLGVELGTSNELFVSEMLDRAGLTGEDVTLVNVRPEEMPAAIGERVDAGFTWEPFATRTIALGNHVLYHPDREAGLFPTVIGFKQSVVEARPDDIRAFNKAWFAAIDFRRQNPDGSRQIVAAHFGVQASDLPVDPQVQILDRTANAAYFEKSSPRGGYTLFTAGRINAEFLVRIGVLASLPDLDALIDPSYLQ